MEKSNTYKHRRIGGRKGKMRLAHHIIWEAINGPIEDGLEIHHIDHNKINNDIENMALLTVSEHQRMHSPFFAKLDGTWVRICPQCRCVRAEDQSRRPICDPCRARCARIERRAKKKD